MAESSRGSSSRRERTTITNRPGSGAPGRNPEDDESNRRRALTRTGPLARISPRYIRGRDRREPNRYLRRIPTIHSTVTTRFDGRVNTWREVPFDGWTPNGRIWGYYAPRRKLGELPPIDRMNFLKTTASYRSHCERFERLRTGAMTLDEFNLFNIGSMHDFARYKDMTVGQLRHVYINDQRWFVRTGQQQF